MKNGVVLAWIDKRENNPNANLYIQKVDLKGNFVWDSSGVMISSSQNMQKSYLNLIPDGDGGAIAVFKGTSDKRNDIYGQKYLAPVLMHRRYLDLMLRLSEIPLKFLVCCK